ncbi:MAG: hypothetical protein HZB80_05460 [Deltaproteobacteria bacterium]|nr:hypothetical protein [Deltaproteobacteria bacterium]
MNLFKSNESQKSDRCPKCHGNLVVGCFKKVELGTIDRRKEVLRAFLF